MILLSRWKVLCVVALAFAAIALTVGGANQSRAQDTKPEAKSDEPAAPKPTPEQQKRIDQLIQQLGADDFEEREKAQKELEKIGPVALEALRQAKKSTEPEIKRGAADLVTKLEEQLKSGTQLAPKKVHLNLKDVSVADAIADLSKQSGYPIKIDGDKAKLVERKITLDTGDVSFWEAFDQLCLKGGLVEPAADAKAAPGVLQVADGTPKPVPTSYAGALRIRFLPDTIKRKDNVAEFMLELSIEPRFRQPKVLGAARIAIALDEQGKALPGLDKPEEQPSLMRAPAALKAGGQKLTLKELTGTVLFETVMADKVLAIDDVAKNVGKSATNDENSSLRLDAYKKEANGDYTLRVSLTKPFPRNPGRGIVIGPDTFKEFQPELRDGNGLPYQKVAAPGQGISITNQMMSITQTITYRPQPGCGEPAELSLTSDKRTALSVPFSFKNVMLP